VPGGPRRFTEAIVGGMIRHQAAGQPGHVGGGVTNRHWSHGVDGPDRSVALRLTHLQIAPLGNVAVEGIGQLELELLVAAASPETLTDLVNHSLSDNDSNHCNSTLTVITVKVMVDR
jgi:hypothetical protein